ncbi:uncharacterized protein LOC107409697 isoform X2 [Ziziphus jujuba]|uniref:Uncharacterized protein LOC107409697 isoform X2 n=2 Tax=Ziziphus jujuba TaxID=326968 RepID=A0ABM3I226_ZIZJJ|nr:uncharacterized protein LOC107409697 isoform X2 [Ziziphus jujuba]KAH7516666.1 hypothetical protein FEM48_Zijuj10G0159400 [Ziziphus jujuba var. spinosa]
MEDNSLQSEGTASDHKSLSVVLDIESLNVQSSDRSSGSPKMTRALSRKWSYRTERLTSAEEEDSDEQPKKLLVRVNSQVDQCLKQPLISSKTLMTPIQNTLGGPISVVDTLDGRNKRFNRFMAINPRNILFILATVSSIGSLILIYFTITINRTVV